MAKSNKNQEFINYVWSFYSPNEIYGSFFENTLTKEEVEKALEIRLSNLETPFDGDSMDREMVRDIMFYNRGKRVDFEYDMTRFFPKAS